MKRNKFAPLKPLTAVITSKLCSHEHCAPTRQQARAFAQDVAKELIRQAKAERRRAAGERAENRRALERAGLI